ncbi:ferrochelatase hem15 [Recurvomyces mirabilis]|nr:ferrochelatase hem15 [Recurvomyces mirabilis]
MNFFQRSLARLQTSRGFFTGRAKSQRSGHNKSDGITSQDESCRASFFGLPAELRIQIYEHVAEQTKIVLPAVRSREKAPKAPGLLMACRRTRQEYYPILLCTAAITVEVIRYDFDNFINVLASMSEEDEAALRSNQRVTVILSLFCSTTREERPALLRWLLHSYRITTKDAGERIPVSYDVSSATRARLPTASRKTATNFSMCRDTLRLCRNILTLAGIVKEQLEPSYALPELERIVADLRKCLQKMDDEARALRDAEDG